MIVLVCGGRDYDDSRRMREVLNELHATSPITLLVHGGARGADSMAGRWAEARSIFVSSYPADWRRHGRAAGPKRNQHILETSHPDLVIAFPGGAGTDDMKRRARSARVEVREIDP